MDVVRPFNQNFSSGQILQYSTASNNMPTQNQTSTSGPTYIVDSQGNIDFPVVGKISTENITKIAIVVIIVLILIILASLSGKQILTCYSIKMTKTPARIS